MWFDKNNTQSFLEVLLVLFVFYVLTFLFSIKLVYDSSQTKTQVLEEVKPPTTSESHKEQNTQEISTQNHSTSIKTSKPIFTPKPKTINIPQKEENSLTQENTQENILPKDTIVIEKPKDTPQVTETQTKEESISLPPSEETKKE